MYPNYSYNFIELSVSDLQVWKTEDNVDINRIWEIEYEYSDKKNLKLLQVSAT